MKKALLLAALLLLACGALLLAQKNDRSKLDPLVVAGETHKLVFENALVRVLETHLPPGAHEPLHAHAHGVTVYLTDFEVRVGEEGHEPLTRQRKGGTAVWSEPVVHEVNNVGKTEGHIFRVELKF